MSIDISSKFYEYVALTLIEYGYAYLYEETDLGFKIKTDGSDKWVTCDPFADSHEGENQRQQLLEFFVVSINPLYDDEGETWWVNGIDGIDYPTRKDAEDGAIVARCIIYFSTIQVEKNRAKIFLP